MTAVVFLHGFTGSPRSFDAVRALLTPALQLFAPPLAGHHGGSDGVASFGAEVERLATWIDERCASPVLLLGYSLGARLALGVAAQHSDRVGALILLSVHPGLASEQARSERRRSDEEHAAFLEQYGTQAFIERWAQQDLFASQNSLPAAALSEQAQVRSQHSAQGLAQCLRVLGLGSMPNHWNALAAVAEHTPVTLVTGSLDPKFEAIAAQAAARHSQIHWRSLANVGHNPLLEAPRAVAEIVQHGLAGIPQRA